VVIVHYARDDLTDALVSDLMNVARRSVERVIVVDNGSPVPYSPASNWADPEVVRLPKGRGYAGAVNAGRQRVNGPHFLLMNNDVRLVDDPIPALLARLDTGAALVGPRVEFPDGRYQLSWGDDLGLAVEMRERRRQQQMRAKRGAALSAREEESLRARRVDWLSGVALLVDVSAYDSVGGFDEAFFFYFEDVDLCRRMRRAGHELWYEPAARVAHLLGGTRDGGGVPIQEHIASAHVLGHLRYYRRHRPAWEGRALKALLLAQVALSPTYRRQKWQRSLLGRLWRDEK
jgi:GT2 family glycosyltransferase